LSEWSHEGPDFACEESFEAADGFCFAFSFGHASGGVGFGWFVVLYSHDDCAVERGIGLSMAATVKPVPCGHS